jgi:hypothetical protein
MVSGPENEAQERRAALQEQPIGLVAEVVTVPVAAVDFEHSDLARRATLLLQRVQHGDETEVSAE